MDKLYKYLKYIIIAEIVIGYILGKMVFKIESIWGNAVGAFLALLPIEVFLYFASKDTKFSAFKRYVFKVIFCVLIFCLILPLTIK